MMNDHRHALRLEYFTVGYNLAEAGASIFFGMAAASIALVGFGLDSIVESLSGFILIWRLAGQSSSSHAELERRETLAVKFVGASFLLLGAYVGYEAVEKLLAAHPPEVTFPGIVIAAASLVVMPVLARAKRRAGERIGSRALLADAKETLACAWLSFALLLGLGANALFGFWQADPIAALAIVFFLFREGWENWKGGECEDGCGADT
jgi:divalent metal cation (Fe/Co/Zn/Cd) transporter